MIEQTNILESMREQLHVVPTSLARMLAIQTATIALLLAFLSPISATAAGNAATGRQLYGNYCVGCHGDEKTRAAVGPDLNGIFGRKAGTLESGIHSQALIDSNIIWNETSLRKFLSSPAKQLPGTYMPAGFPDARQVDDLIAYLRTLR